MAKLWKKGRGKLGPFQPIIGKWVADAASPMGPLRCYRTLEPILDGHYIQLAALWEFGPKGSGKGYREVAIIGVGDDGAVGFWSFTSDGKRSQGVMADVTDIDPEAIGFEVQMPAGLARMVYWPEAAVGFRWAVESKTKKGWNRFVEHVYHAA